MFEVLTCEMYEFKNVWIVRINRDIKIEIPTYTQALEFILNPKQNLLNGLLKKEYGVKI